MTFEWKKANVNPICMICSLPINDDYLELPQSVRTIRICMNCVEKIHDKYAEL